MAVIIRIIITVIAAVMACAIAGSFLMRSLIFK